MDRAPDLRTQKNEPQNKTKCSLNQIGVRGCHSRVIFSLGAMGLGSGQLEIFVIVVFHHSTLILKEYITKYTTNINITYTYDINISANRCRCIGKELLIGNFTKFAGPPLGHFLRVQVPLCAPKMQFGSYFRIPGGNRLLGHHFSLKKVPTSPGGSRQSAPRAAWDAIRHPKWSRDRYFSIFGRSWMDFRLFFNEFWWVSMFLFDEILTKTLKDILHGRNSSHSNHFIEQKG